MKENSPADREAITNRTGRVFTIQLQVETADQLERIAQTNEMQVEQLLQQLVAEYVVEESRSVEDRIRLVYEHVECLIAAVKDELFQVRIASGTVTFEERQRKRAHLVELGMRAFEEISRISESEQVAKESEFRLQSFQVLARVGAFTSAVIQNQDEADVVDLLKRVEKVNRELEKRLKKVKAREEELEDQARKTW